MPLTFVLPVRTWAVLDMALAFFRRAPVRIEAAQRLARPCQRLHRHLHRVGVRSEYLHVGMASPGRALLRLQICSLVSPHQLLAIELPTRMALRVGQACLAIIEVQADAEIGPLLEHEVSELLACRTYLSLLRRQQPELCPAPADGEASLRWDSRRQEFVFGEVLSRKVHQHFLRAGAAIN